MSRSYWGPSATACVGCGVLGLMPRGRFSSIVQESFGWLPLLNPQPRFTALRDNATLATSFP